MAMPCWRTISKTSTANPAAGPLTCNGEPAIQPTTSPPMMPVIKPLAGGMPEAMAMPMHRGRATRNTTTEAINSRGKIFLKCSARMETLPKQVQANATFGCMTGSRDEARSMSVRSALWASQKGCCARRSRA
jgi:hypothetical protein